MYHSKKISVIKEQRGIVTNPELIEAICRRQTVAGRSTMTANQMEDVIQRWVSEQQVMWLKEYLYSLDV